MLVHLTDVCPDNSVQYNEKIIKELAQMRRVLALFSMTLMILVVGLSFTSPHHQSIATGQITTPTDVTNPGVS